MKFIDYDYYYTKQFTAICFTKNVKEYFASSILTDKYLQFLYKKIVDYDEFAIINEQMKYNLLELINFIRFNKTLNNEQIEMINKIIVKINYAKVSFYPFQCYLAEEFDIRVPEGEYELNFFNDTQIDGLLECIELDYKVLKSLVCKEEDFDDIVYPELILNEYYFWSINKLNSEVPLLLIEKQERIMQVIAANKLFKKRKNKKNIEGYNRKDFNIIINKGNKLLKKMKK